MPTDDLADRLNALEVSWSTLPGKNDDHQSALLREVATNLAKGDRRWSRLEKVERALASFSFRLRPAGDGSDDLAIEMQCDETSGETIALLVDLIAASRSSNWQLRRCFNDGIWFSPGLRSARSKFCSVRCRNRFNYDLRSGASFVCADCWQVRSIGEFSGLSREGGSIRPAFVRTEYPICAACITQAGNEWNEYVDIAAISTVVEAHHNSSGLGYRDIVNRLIEEELGRNEGPVHYSKIAKHVTDNFRIKGRSPDLTILGYLLRTPSLFRQTSKHMFELAREPISQPVKGHGRNLETSK